MMKSIAISTAILVLTAGMAAAKPASHFSGKSHHKYSSQHKSYQSGKLTLRERIVLAQKRARLAKLKRKIISDGVVTRREKQRLRTATNRYKASVRRERRD